MNQLHRRAMLLLMSVGLTTAASADDVSRGDDCVDAPENLVAWWTGDGDADDFLGSLHGSFVGDAGTAPGLIGDAFSFDGADDYVSFGDPPELDFDGDFTVTMWINFAGPLGTRGTHIYHRRSPDCGEGDGEIGLAREDGSLQFATGVFEQRVVSGLIVPTDEWAFIAVAYHADSGAETVDFFVDDESLLSVPTGPLGNPDTAAVTLGQVPGCPTEDSFHGLIERYTRMSLMAV